MYETVHLGMLRGWLSDGQDGRAEFCPDERAEFGKVPLLKMIDLGLGLVPKHNMEVFPPLIHINAKF